MLSLSDTVFSNIKTLQHFSLVEWKNTVITVNTELNSYKKKLLVILLSFKNVNMSWCCSKCI